MATNQNVTVGAPQDAANVTLKPGDVAFRALNRRDDKFFVKFAWCDMLGGLHEQEFDRGDVFANFNEVYRVFTEGGLPIDPAKVDEFHTRLCQLSTVLVRENEPTAPKAAQN